MIDRAGAHDLEAWADQYGLTHPVTGDAPGLAEGFNITVTPSEHLILRGGEVYGTFTDISVVEDAIYGRL